MSEDLLFRLFRATLFCFGGQGRYCSGRQGKAGQASATRTAAAAGRLAELRLLLLLPLHVVRELVSRYSQFRLCP